MVIHRIHLHGPWECEPIHDDGGKEALDRGPRSPRQLTIPCRWDESGLGDFHGVIRLRRRFHWPNTLDSREQLWLNLTGVREGADAWLNGRKLSEATNEAFEFEVSGLVEVKNELIVEVERRDSPEGVLPASVVLEVRRGE